MSALDIYLTSEGYQTVKAYNGREAIRAAEGREVHLILMDIMMPELDGIRVKKLLRIIKLNASRRKARGGQNLKEKFHRKSLQTEEKVIHYTDCISMTFTVLPKMFFWPWAAHWST